MLVENLALGKSTQQGSAGRIQVDPVFPAQKKGFAQRGDGLGNDDLVGQLGALPRTARAHVGKGRPENLKDGTDSIHAFLPALASAISRSIICENRRRVL